MMEFLRLLSDGLMDYKKIRDQIVNACVKNGPTCMESYRPFFKLPRNCLVLNINLPVYSCKKKKNHCPELFSVADY